MTPEEKALLAKMDGDIGILVLVQGTLANGEAHYAYVSIPPSRYMDFKEAEARGHYDLAAYGKIFAHGAGRTPPADVQKRMKEEHGANHHFEEELDQWMRSLQTLQNGGQA